MDVKGGFDSFGGEGGEGGDADGDVVAHTGTLEDGLIGSFGEETSAKVGDHADGDCSVLVFGAGWPTRVRCALRGCGHFVTYIPFGWRCISMLPYEEFLCPTFCDDLFAAAGFADLLFACGCAGEGRAGEVRLLFDESGVGAGVLFRSGCGFGV